MIFVNLLFLWFQPAHASEFDVKRESFLQQMKQEGLRSFCSENGMSRCFKISEADCKATFESGFARCQKAVKIPKQISLLGQDEQIQTELGACIGTEYGKNHFTKFKEGSECAVRK